MGRTDKDSDLFFVRKEETKTRKKMANSHGERKKKIEDE